MLRFEDALARIHALGAPVLGFESALVEDADGRVLAEELVGSLEPPRVVAIAPGTRLGPGQLAYATAIGRSKLTVTRRPVVAVLSWPDELARRDTPEAIAVALRTTARRAGATVLAGQALARALDDADLLVTVGGVGAPETDRVRAVLAASGVHLELWRVAIKPGAPFGVATLARPGRRDVVVLALPDDAGALVAFGIFGVPLLRAQQGDAQPFPTFLRARTTRAHAHDPGRIEMARAVVAQTHDGFAVTTLPNQAASTLTTMAHANALACIPASASGVGAGEEIDVLLLRDLCS